MTEKAKRNYTLKVWRQKDAHDAGRMAEYRAEGISPDASFLEMLDIVNEQLVRKGEDPIAFDSDCREGICGMCSCVIDGRAHGPGAATATCQLHMRAFEDGATIVVEPFRARAFPPVKDLVVDRSAFDRIIASGGFVSVNVGSAPDGNTHLVPHPVAEKAMDAAACIGCGACVAACPNASAMLFVAAKISQLSLLPQGQPERAARALNMLKRMEDEDFGNCSNHGECEAVCPKEIKLSNIARTNREFIRASVCSDE
ncbi:MAG: succinate dehydrogenase/fumarate reductase iron-sulfur subunit [Elusimicrobia bacterium]|nr:succinate dehydrogenase/fumarate reductase iron-sulfur subunit [Elusimicrobiota bacterium]